MIFKRDKLLHGLAGFLSALAGMALACVVPALAGRAPDLAAVASGALIAATVAGITKEAADHQDNMLHPGMHGVELADAVATAAPGWLLALALVLADEVLR